MSSKSSFERGGKFVSRTVTDDRVWLPDLNEVIDWEALYDNGRVQGAEATWWLQATGGVNYYRGEMPAKHFPGQALHFESRDLQRRHDDHQIFFPRQEGKAVWMFPGTTALALIITEMHLQGYEVWVEVDDNYTTAPPIPGLSQWQSMIDRSGQDIPSYEVHRRIVKGGAVDGVIVSTPKLWEIYSRLHPNVHVCMNSIDVDDWGPEDPPHQKDGILRIGWAGSASHGYDIAEIKQALSWAAQQKDVEVVLLGQLSLPFEHRNVPWTDSLAQYRKNIEELDVILCPLRPSEWADCKSDVKALEGAMGGALPVVSKTEPYRPWWDRTYVAEKRADWLKIVKHLVSHRDEVRATWWDAYDYVVGDRTIETGIEAWRCALT